MMSERWVFRRDLNELKLLRDRSCVWYNAYATMHNAQTIGICNLHARMQREMRITLWNENYEHMPNPENYICPWLWLGVRLGFGVNLLRADIVYYKGWVKN